MTSTVVVGCMLDLVDSSSESDSESDSEIIFKHENQEPVKVIDEEEEEIEVFNSDGSKAIPNCTEHHKPSFEAKGSLLSANESPLVKGDGTGFGIQYKPLPIVNLDHMEGSMAAKIIHNNNNENFENVEPESDDEFTFSEDSHNIVAITEEIQKLLKTHEQLEQQLNFNEYSLNQTNASQAEICDSNDGFRFGAIPSIDEPLILKTEPLSSEHLSNKQALKDIIDIYGAGLGDQEVLLLDSDCSDLNVLDKPTEVSRGLSVIAEEEEEEHDYDDVEAEIAASQEFAESNNQSTEWDSLEAPSVHSDIGLLPALPSTVSLAMNYHQALQYFQTLNLSEYESMIVTQESSKTASLFSFTSPPKLDFPEADSQLKFPFLIACLDYNPFCRDHFFMLKEIFIFFVGEFYDSAQLQPIDNHWEFLGFQGKDPRTDLNRSMKLLTVLQMLHFMETNTSLAKYLFTLSQSWKTPAVEKGGFDPSWPFMCVSILFTKEAIQTMRSGALNAECNKRKEVLAVLHEYHHACFSEFCILLKREPTVHHATLLAKLRTLSGSKPWKILEHFRKKKYMNVSPVGESEIEMESLTELCNIPQDEPSSNGRTKGWKSIFRPSKADKFAI